MSDEPTFERTPGPHNEPVIRVLKAMYEDACNGGITSFVAVTVNGSGLSIQTPGQFYQIKEILHGLDELRRKLILEYQMGHHGVVDGFKTNGVKP